MWERHPIKTLTWSNSIIHRNYHLYYATNERDFSCARSRCLLSNSTTTSHCGLHSLFNLHIRICKELQAYIIFQVFFSLKAIVCAELLTKTEQWLALPKDIFQHWMLYQMKEIQHCSCRWSRIIQELPYKTWILSNGADRQKCEWNVRQRFTGIQ